MIRLLRSRIPVLLQARVQDRLSVVSNQYVSCLSRQSSTHHALRDLLSSDHLSVINEERDLLGELHGTLSALEVPRESLDLVADTRQRIDDLFMMVIVGEFNAGKSTFINSLLGAEYLKTGVLPTTDKICLLRSARPAENEPLHSLDETPSARELSSKHVDGTHAFLLDDVEDAVVPTQWLRNVALIDTPGTNALLAKHEQLTSRIVPRADLVLFVTSAERPLSDSEAAFLDKISKWGKRILVVINKMDVLPNDNARNQVTEYVRSHIAARLGRIGTDEPVPLFPLSAKLALEAKLRLDDDDTDGLTKSPEWRRSGLHSLESHLRETLASSSVVASKLRNPLSICDRLVGEQLQEMHTRQDTLVADVRTVEMLRENSSAFHQDVKRDSRYAEERVEVLVSQQRARLDQFLSDEIVQGSLPSLMDLSGLEAQLIRAASLDLKRPLQETIFDLTELVSARSQAQARTILQYVGDRHEINPRAKTFIGSLTPTSAHRLDDASKELRARLQRRCEEVLKEALADQDESLKVSMSTMRSGFVQLATLHATTLVSLGAILINSASFNASELPVAVAASLVPAALTSMVLPRVQRKIQATFNTRAANLQERIQTSLQTVTDLEVNTISALISASVAPYERFVDYERRTTDEMIARLESLRRTARHIRGKLDKMR